jgi:hypothetical protein
MKRLLRENKPKNFIPILQRNKDKTADLIEKCEVEISTTPK